MKSLPVLAVSALATLAFTGCAADNTGSTTDPTPKKGSESSESTETPTADTPVEAGDPAKTLRTVASGLANGDGAVCDLMTDNMKTMSLTMAAQAGIVKAGASCEEYVVGLPAFLEKSGVTTKTTVASAKVDSQTDGKATGTVVVVNNGVTSTNSYNLVNTDGKWLIDSPIEGSTKVE